jgi:hypothetical protein
MSVITLTGERYVSYYIDRRGVGQLLHWQMRGRSVIILTGEG